MLPGRQILRRNRGKPTIKPQPQPKEIGHVDSNKVIDSQHQGYALPVFKFVFMISDRKPAKGSVFVVLHEKIDSLDLTRKGLLRQAGSQLSPGSIVLFKNTTAQISLFQTAIPENHIPVPVFILFILIQSCIKSNLYFIISVYSQNVYTAGVSDGTPTVCYVFFVLLRRYAKIRSFPFLGMLRMQNIRSCSGISAGDVQPCISDIINRATLFLNVSL